jgi:hypothetical protein
MMIPESNDRDLDNPTKGSAHHINENPTFIRDKMVVDGHPSVGYKRWPNPHEEGHA